MDSERLTWLEKETSKSFKRSRLLKDLAISIGNGGTSKHSAKGDSLKMILIYLERAGVSYQLTAHPKYGYYIQGIPREEWMDKDEQDSIS